MNKSARRLPGLWLCWWAAEVFVGQRLELPEGEPHQKEQDQDEQMLDDLVGEDWLGPGLDLPDFVLEVHDLLVEFLLFLLVDVFHGDQPVGGLLLLVLLGPRGLRSVELVEGALELVFVGGGRQRRILLAQKVRIAEITEADSASQ